MITLKGKYDGSEDNLQIVCMEYLRYGYPYLFAVHIANERKTQARQNKQGKWFTPLGNKLKAKGVIAGMPDILIFDKCYENDADYLFDKYYRGMAIELKVFPNTLKPAQKEVLEKLSARGWLCFVIYNFDLFKQTVDKYYGNR